MVSCAGTKRARHGPFAHACGRVVLPAVELFDAQPTQRGHGLRSRGVGEAAAPQLAVVVEPPGPDLSVGRERERVIGSGGGGDDWQRGTPPPQRERLRRQQLRLGARREQAAPERALLAAAPRVERASHRHGERVVGAARDVPHRRQALEPQRLALHVDGLAEAECAARVLVRPP